MVFIQNVIIFIKLLILFIDRFEGMRSMKNNNAISEMINQTRLIEKNNLNNMEYTTNITSLASSEDLAQIRDEKISRKIKELHKQIEDINRLTSDLLNDLTRKYN